MIKRLDIETRVREWSLREDVVEKDYVLGWLLWGIGTDGVLCETWAFKGGTCLKKCYVETHRFSEDLDFTVLPGGPVRDADVLPIFQAVLQRVYKLSGINFSDKSPFFETHSSGLYTSGRVYYRGPRDTPSVASVKLDLSAAEKVVRPTVLRPISHPYSDELPAPGTVRCYSFEEVFAEKIRAMGERSRPRDLYDIVNLFRREDLHRHPKLISDVLAEKCVSKGVEIPTLAALESSPYRQELESEWSNMLAHQLPQLPPFETFWAELPSLFEWLAGQYKAPELKTVPSKEPTDNRWTPPATVWRWGTGIPVESIRFAAANHLCIELGYQGTTRLIEPYAFRRSKAGAILLCAIKVQTRETRTYRVDRIETVKVSNRPFRPAFRIEIGGFGGTFAPQIRKPQVGGQPHALLSAFPRRRHTNSGSRTVYVIKCPGCGREFKRYTEDTALRVHKGKGGWQCHSLAGYLLRTEYK